MFVNGKVLMEDVARQLLRAIRGKRSQLAFARRLGYRGNPIPKWEGGHRFPTAVETLRACGVVGIDVDGAVAAFHPSAAPAWRREDPSAWLDVLRGDASQVDLAGRAGVSRQAVGRALRGDSEPRLPEWLRLVEAATGRVADLVAQLVDIDEVPALVEQVALRRSVRQLAFDQPWSPAVLAFLDTLPAGRRSRGLVGRLAQALLLDESQALALLDEVERSGALDAAAHGVGLTVDVAPTVEEHRRLRAHWAQVAADRVAGGSDDVFSFNVFALSRADLQRVQDLQRAFFREVRGVVAGSSPEVAAFLTIQTGSFDPA